MDRNNEQCNNCWRKDKCIRKKPTDIINIITNSDKFDIIQPNEVCENESPYGNSYLILSDYDIEALKNGKVIRHDDGEYCTFIGYVTSNLD